MTARKPDTIAVEDGRMSDEHFGVVNTPVYRASTILFPDLKSIDDGSAKYVYGRRGTPTTRSFEEAVTALEGGKRTVTVPSGLNAIATAILSVCSSGDEILVADSVYVPTKVFCEKTLRRMGVTTRYYDPLIGAAIEGLFTPKTKAVFCESPGSLTFEVQDISAIAEVAHAKGASVLIDNTWATPIYFQPLKHGVDLSIQAATKYVGGHADVMLGYVTANESHAARLAETHGNMGLYASGDDCFLGLRGLRTLSVRLARHQATAMKLVKFLEGRPETARIFYPALESDPGYRLWKRDFSGACGLFGFELKPVSRNAVAAFVEGLQHFGIGYSWGGFESLIIPAHIKRHAAPFAAEGPVLRIHAGLEDENDLLTDLEDGLARLRKTV